MDGYLVPMCDVISLSRANHHREFAAKLGEFDYSYHHFFPTPEVHLIENEEEEREGYLYTQKMNVKHLIFAYSVRILTVQRLTITWRVKNWQFYKWGG